MDLYVYEVTFPEFRNCQTKADGDWDECEAWDPFTLSGRPDIAVRLQRRFTPIAMTYHIEDAPGTKVVFSEDGGPGEKLKYNFDLDDRAPEDEHEPLTIQELIDDASLSAADRRVWINILDLDASGAEADLPEDGRHDGFDARFQNIMASCPLIVPPGADGLASQSNVEQKIDWRCEVDGLVYTAEFGLRIREDVASDRTMDRTSVSRIHIHEVAAPFSKDADSCSPHSDERQRDSGRCVWDREGSISRANEWHPDLQVRFTVLDKPLSNPLGNGGSLDRAFPLDEGYVESIGVNYVGAASTEGIIGMNELSPVHDGRGVWDFDEEELVVQGLTPSAMAEGRVFVEFLDVDDIGEELMSRCFFQQGYGDSEDIRFGRVENRTEAGGSFAGRFVCNSGNGLGGRPIEMGFKAYLR